MQYKTTRQGTPYIDEAPREGETIDTNVVQVYPGNDGLEINNYWGTVKIVIQLFTPHDQIEPIIDLVAKLDEELRERLA